MIKSFTILFSLFVFHLSHAGDCIANKFKYTFHSPDVEITLTTFDGVHFSSLLKTMALHSMQAPPHCSFLDLGTGNGAFALWALHDKHCDHSVGTDILPLAIENARFNAKDLKLEHKVDFRLVDLKTPGAYSVIKDEEKFDVIFSNPPFYSRPVHKLEELSYSDPGFAFTRSIINGYKTHLLSNGHLYLMQGQREGIALIFKMIKDKKIKGQIIWPVKFKSYEDMTKALGNDFQEFPVMFELS